MKRYVRHLWIAWLGKRTCGAFHCNQWEKNA